MRRLAPALILALLLLACLVAVYLTGGSESPRVTPPKNAARAKKAFEQGPLLPAAHRMAPLAETSDEQGQAREALHLADHELDLAFAGALREAAAYRVPPAGPLHDLATRIGQLRTQVGADQNRIAQFGKQPASNVQADQLELAKAQLSLDQDELDDAQQDLARQGGDPHSDLERALQEHEGTQHQAAQSVAGGSPAPVSTLIDQIRAWVSLGVRDRDLLVAERQALSWAADLTARHNTLEQELAGEPDSASTSDTAAMIANLRHLSDQRKTLTELDQRVQDCRQLAGVYKSWSGLLETRRASVFHLLLTSVAKILGILLAATLGSVAIRRTIRGTARQRMSQMHLIAVVAIQLAAIALVLLVLFGAPNQLTTMIGLATAGLTVVLRDFIVGFFGWFALMGKNGISVGDWVEINGISGEVVEIGLLKTVLLELGAWTNTGHPTGRRVSISNSFAIEGHFFNFSTKGQWLWDELVVSLPANSDAYAVAQQICRLVERETDADSVQAAQDWERVTRGNGARNFSARPAADLRPTANGLEVVVRYITHAPQRYAMKSKLLQLIVDLLHTPPRTEAAPLAPAAARVAEKDR